jgi:hypothetical protein
MRNLILFALFAIVAASVYFYFADNTDLAKSLGPQPSPTPATPPPPTPEEQISALIEQRAVDATRLAKLCEAYPDLAQRILANRLVNVTGIIRGFQTLGLDANKAHVVLDNSTRRKLVLLFDLNKHAVLGISPDERSRSKFIIIGKELYLVSLDGRNRQLLYAEGDKLTKKARYDRIGIATITLTAEQ